MAADPTTTNKGLLLQSTGTASGQWGANLNNLVFTIIDEALGSTTPVTVAGSDVNLTSTQIQNLAMTVTGTLSGNVNLVLPLSGNSTTQAVGGLFVFNHQAAGNFAVNVKTIASGSTGVQLPYGRCTTVYSDGTNVLYADDAQNQTQVFNGNPNSNVAGQAGSASTRASKIIDYSTNQEYLCTSTGTAGNAVWSINFPFTMPSQGFLTPNSDATSPVLTADSLGASTIYFTGMFGNLIWIYNGTSFTPNVIPGGQIQLALSGSAQASNGIYDVVGFVNTTGALVVGFSPAWSTPTVGSGARGSGAGTPQLTRVSGILVNAVQQTINNGATSYTVAANKGTYLGSVWIDGTAGQVTCHRSYGQSRKFGVWNYYNRVPIELKGGDSTATWPYATSATIRPANNNSANNVSTFTGMAEEEFDIDYLASTSSATNAGSPISTGVGWNSTASFSGFFMNPATPAGGTKLYFESRYINAPALGINTAYCLEQGNASITVTFAGTESNMQMLASYRG